MSNKENKENKDKETKEKETPETEAENAEACDTGTESEGKSEGETESEDAKIDYEALCKVLTKKLEETEDRCTRVLAEYDNFRKRVAKEKEALYTDACGDTLRELLPVTDTLELALKYPDNDKVYEGVRLTLSKLEESLKKLGVTEIECVGKTFDPNLHNAVMHIEDENYAENTIIEVFQKGYIRGERVLRHAMVKVAN